ncbi:uncharacterized protein LOC127251932 [Andrographis paniculata]|uniref:uncharacterized protein LOC127251932 n=1 Tax=Andrographis paniculata TaxID=175694 RepID=UPI0021E72196|nr:uncharacterized protein LOC127251932 [Andrographis paniculata]
MQDKCQMSCHNNLKRGSSRNRAVDANFLNFTGLEAGLLQFLNMEEMSAVEARERLNKKKMKVLVPMDESNESFYALRWAIDHFFTTTTQYDSAALKPEEEDVTVTLVHVRKLFQPFIYPAGPAVYATPSVVDSVRKAQEQVADDILSRALHICKEHKINAETLILEGDPKGKICDAAEQLQVDCVVLGSRGLGAIKRALLGSVSDYCAHYLACPVLIVKPPAKAEHD